MSLTGLSPAGSLMIRAGEPYALSVQFCDNAGVAQSMIGRLTHLSVRFIDQSEPLPDMVVTGVLSGDGKTVSFGLDGAKTAALLGYDQQRALSYDLTEQSGAITWTERVIVSEGSGVISNAPVLFPDLPASEMTILPGAVLRVTQRGAQGLNAAEVLAGPGIIPEGTAEAFNEYLIELATSDVAGQAGAAAGAAAASALLATKADKNSPAFTGTPTAPAPTSLADKLSNALVRVGDVAKFFANRQGNRALMPAEWAGGTVLGGALDFRPIMMSDLGPFRTGKYGDLAPMEWLRLFFLPVEIEGYSMAQSDASLAVNTLIQEHDPRGLWFGQPTYQMDSPILPSLLSNIILACASAGPFGPATMEFINPAQKPFSFGPTNGGVEFRGTWIIEHRVKPAPGVPSVELVGTPWVSFEDLVIRNAALALRLVSGRGRIKRLFVDADVATADAVGIDFDIGEIIRIPGLDGNMKANAISGGQYTSIRTPGTGRWLPPPSITATTPGSLATVDGAPVYGSSNGASWRRNGSRIYVRGSASFTLPGGHTASGPAQFAGLPFPVKAGSENFQLAISDINNQVIWPGTATQIALRAMQGTNYMNLVGYRSGNTSIADISAFPAGVLNTIRFSGEYETELAA